MKLTIVSAERTQSGTAAALLLSNGKTVIVGNKIVNKALDTSELAFSTFAALVCIGGFDLDIPGDIVEHSAGEPHDSGHYRNDGFHMELEEDAFPSVVLANSPIAIGLMFQLPQDRKAVLLPIATKATGTPEGPPAEFKAPEATEPPAEEPAKAAPKKAAKATK